MWTTQPRPERSTSFGSAAADYERWRLEYPDAVVDAVLAYADHPVRTAIEIGAGTGKATRVFARRGIAVTATDPDPAMLAELRRRVAEPVTTVVAPLEGLEARGPFDLLLAASSMHWTRADGRWRRVADLLGDGGVVASAALLFDLADAATDAAVTAAWGSDRPAPPGPVQHVGGMAWPGDEMAASGLFTDVREVRLPRRVRLTVEQYLGLQSTVSAYLVLPQDRRRAVLGRLRQALPDAVEVDADVVLHLGRRAADPT